ncbi:pali-domain-containing protein [Phlebopus sp. FC_14]|nr:pali-domain-containing protein [Phlebopus sp. FC_14]
MGFIRPATPGFLVTLVATILLAVVSFSVPLIKSVYFLKASLAVENISGYITLGTLGYCTTINGVTSCSSATVGYELSNVNALVGDTTAIQIPDVAVKWITYVLVLHIVAFALAGVAALFGLLAHVREMAMTCFSSCVSGFAATVALVAFIFDIALFFIAKSRMNAVSGGSASIGNAVWLTLASWVLLFFSGCFYGIGRCCIKRRSRDGWGGKPGTAIGLNGYGDRDNMQLDAVKAEADRKARQNQVEGGLPSFHEYEQSQPLKARVDGDEVYLEEDVPYRDNQSVSTAGRAGLGSFGRRQSQGGYAGGYVRAPPGTRAVDEYNNSSSYPPMPQRQASTHTQVTASSYPSSYPPSSSTYSPAAPSVPTPASTSALQSNSYFNVDPYSPQAYGHVAGSSSYNAPTQQSYSPYDPYGAQSATRYAEPSFNPDTYNTTAAMTSTRSPYSAPYNPPSSPVHQPERSYAALGGGFGAGGLSSANDPYYANSRALSTSPPQASRSPALPESQVAAAGSSATPVKGPRLPRASTIVMAPPPSELYTDSPPTYESGASAPPGQWGSKD